MEKSKNQAIVRKSYTISLTFTDKPSEELRKKMKNSGFEFKNGQWYRNASDSAICDEAGVEKHIA